jgi:exopolyphosphatase/guanosine-5'-triphosphate,3'-diphosphate pyrophosphatase
MIARGRTQRKLKPEEARRTRLLAAQDMNAREARTPGHAFELFGWMTPLFPKETQRERRIREAACQFADIGWRRHPDDRAMGAFTQVLRGAYGAADHHERALMATAVYYRYAGDGDFPEETGVGGLLGVEGRLAQQSARRVAGLGLRGARGELPR